MDESRSDHPPSEALGREAGDRAEGLIIETCYRHRREPTGVHCTRCGRPICTECMNPAAVGYQCPDCLAAAKRSWPGRRGPISIRRRFSLTTLLLAVNVLMFVVEVAVGASSFAGGIDPQKLFDLGALQPLAIAWHHQYWRLITAMFLHAGLLHIALNMYGLYLFGYLIEGAFGPWRFLAIYFVSGFLASVSSFVLGNPNAVGVGASGAIFGLLGAWVAYNYRRRSSAFASANLRWALMLITINLFLGFSLAGIDNFAHIGGLAAGFVGGFLAEGFGPRHVRPLVQIGGLVTLVLVGVAFVVWRVSGLSPSFPVEAAIARSAWWPLASLASALT